MKKIKIAYYIQDLHIGGAEKLLIQLIEALNQKQFDVILITQKREGVLWEHLPEKLSRTYTTRNPFRLYSILKHEKPDIFHSHLWRADFSGIPVARLAGIDKCFSTKHNTNYFKGKKFFLKIFDALILRLTEKVISVTDATKNHYLSSFLYARINFTTIYNGIDLNPFQSIKKHSHPHIPLKLLTVANLIEQKGHVNFLKVLSKIKDINFEWHLVGDGICKKNILNQAKQFNLHEKVIIHGWQKDVLSFYEKADLFILPSLWEGFGLVLIEAMASQVPVFASNVEGIKEIIENNETGILFSYQNIDETVEKLRELIRNEKLQEKLRTKALERIDSYSIKETTRNYCKLYLETMEYQS